MIIALLTSGAATRSPSHSHCTAVVGYARTWKLHGLMNKSAIPWPIVRMIHSSKLAGFFVFEADLASAAASAMPVRHAILSSSSSAVMLFWKGYATHRCFSDTCETRSRVFNGSSLPPCEDDSSAASISSSKNLQCEKMTWPPMSKRNPSGVTSVQARPPGSGAWSIRSQSVLPCWWRSVAAPSPVGPAPTTRTPTCLLYI